MNYKYIILTRLYHVNNFVLNNNCFRYIIERLYVNINYQFISHDKNVHDYEYENLTTYFLHKECTYIYSYLFILLIFIKLRLC